MYRPPLAYKAPYLYETWYESIDYAYAYQWFRSHTPTVAGACSTVRKGNLIGRNLDWTYDESAEFIVHTDSVVGVANAIPTLTDAFVQSGADSELYKIVPFMLSDGMNKHGLFVSTLVVPTDKGDNSVVHPTELELEELCTLMLPRFVLDRFDNADSACGFLTRFVRLYHPKTLQDKHYDQHFVIADKHDTFCMEFVDGQYVVLDLADKPFVTNFHLHGVTFNADWSVNTPASGKASDNKITPNGSGLERFNLINSYTGDIGALMRELSFTRAYQSHIYPAVPRWDTEFVGNGRTVDTPTADYDDVQIVAALEYVVRSRDDGRTWQTVHSAIYDIDSKKLSLVVQEQYDTQWEVSLMARNTPSPIQQFRGSAASLDAYTGPVGELTVDTTNKTARVQDGATRGGNPLVNTTTAQNVAGVKTFAVSPIVPTQNEKDNSTKAASTEYVDRAVENIDPATLPKTSKDNLGVAQVGSGLHVKDGVVGLGEVAKPSITSPSAGGTVPKSGFAVTGSEFNALYISDTQKSARWVVYQNGALVADVTSTSDLTSHTFTSSELSGLNAGAATLQVQYTGNIAGESEFSEPVNITIQSASVNQPTITAPTANADVYPSASILVSTSAFSVSGGSDTHKDTDYMITTGEDRSGVVAQALASSDKTSHTFPASALTGMTVNNPFYIHARHRGTTLGESPWATPVRVTAKAGQVTPTNRTVFRHPSNKGSVIVYDEFGVTKNLLVYDAAYRTRANKAWGTSGTDIPGINNWAHYWYCSLDSIDTSSGYVNYRDYATLPAARFTDAKFQQVLGPTLRSVLQSAKAATDILMGYSDTQAAHFCREQNSVISGIEAQLPNIYQLLVMYAEGDTIDALDPTLAANPTMALGKYTNTYRWFSGNYAWSSTEHSSANACTMGTNGLTGYGSKTYQYSVAPVAEI